MLVMGREVARGAELTERMRKGLWRIDLWIEDKSPSLRSPFAFPAKSHGGKESVQAEKGRGPISWRKRVLEKDPGSP